MEIVQNATELIRYLTTAVEIGRGRPILIDKYLEGREVEVDAICDGERVLIPGIMEHVERAGVHSGDSMAIYPGLTLTTTEVDTLVDYTTRIALGLGTKGLINIQYVIMGMDPYRDPATFKYDDNDVSAIYVLEANPGPAAPCRSSPRSPACPWCSLQQEWCLAERCGSRATAAGCGRKRSWWG